MKMRVSKESDKLVEKWSNRDFVLYYSNKLVPLTGHRLEIPPEAWLGFMSRMKAFRKKHELDAIAYKQFIDNVFDTFFTQKGYVPAFSAIVSIKVYTAVQLLQKKRGHKQQSMYNNEAFLALRDQLYGDSTLFQKGVQ